MITVLESGIVATAAGRSGFPPGDLPEIAFLGRSNSGKSSLLNRLAQRRQLARTSATPGKTRLANFFRLRIRIGARDAPHRVASRRGPELAPAPHAGDSREPIERALLLVDLPGYGFAQVSQTERESWRGLVESYLEHREPLRAVVLLLDLRRDPRDQELDLLAWLEARSIPVVLALTRADKLAPMQRARRAAALARTLRMPAEQIVTTSSLSGLGIDALWQALLGRL